MSAERQLLVTAVQRMTLDDGSGLRTTVFFKGCPLKCPWCCNPETQSGKPETFYNEERCAVFKGSKYCGSCDDVFKLENTCPFGARELVGEWFTVNQLKAKIEASGYLGVTFSGGEPLLQGENLCVLMRSLKEEGYNIAVETALSVPPLEEMYHWVDEWIVDLKFQSPYYTFLPTVKLSNATYRLVVFAELLDNNGWLPWLIKQLKKYSVNSIELLSYHTLGHVKFQRLKRCFSTFTTPTADDIFKISSALVEAGIKIKYLHI